MQLPDKSHLALRNPDAAFDLVVIAASAGGIGSLGSLLETLPANFAAPIAIVQHLPPSAVYVSQLPCVLQKTTRLRVKWAEHNEEIGVGTVYVAPQDLTTTIDIASGNLAVTPTTRLRRPSADPLFRSAAAAFGSRVLAIVLSGVLNDGAKGAAAIARAGGRVLAQAPSDADFKDMPLAAMESSQTGLPFDRHSLAHVTTTLVMTPGAASWFPIGKTGVGFNLLDQTVPDARNRVLPLHAEMN